ncbi:MAG TPA: alanine racemase [Firmicutes bacterium]|nr:alanine racemase [Bacillota bacterium]
MLDRPTRAEINLENIAHNMREIRKRIGPGPEIMAVVKADAYGHGAERVSATVLGNGATWLGVATVEEGVLLRKSGIIAPILILGTIFPAQARRALRYGLTVTVSDYEFAEALALCATQEGRKAKVHVKVDTGMGRIGVTPEDTVAFVKRLTALPNIEVEGIFTHFATADSDLGFARVQLHRFNKVITSLLESGIKIPIRHAANSAAILNLPESYFNMVRAGIIIYGLSPFGSRRGMPLRTGPGSSSSHDPVMDLRPALSLKTRVAYVKRVPAGTPVSYGSTYVTNRATTIATLPVGYADGLLRALSNKAHVLIRGGRYPVAGTICMDACMVDVGDLEVEVGDEAVLIGRQGNEEISAEEVAEAAGTINYEIVCAISKRVPRVYSQDN